NLIRAANIWTGYNNSDRDRRLVKRLLRTEKQHKWVDTFGWLHKMPEGHFTAHLHNVIRALAPDDPAAIALSGLKVGSFHSDLGAVLHPTPEAQTRARDKVTNDLWGAYIMGLDPENEKADRFGYKPEGRGGLLYGAVSAKVRHVARSLGIHPDEVQAAMWSS